MSEQLLLTPPQAHEVEIEHIQNYWPLGIWAVRAEEHRVELLLGADYHERAAAYAEGLVGVPEPSGHPIGRLVGKVLGKAVIGPEAKTWLESQDVEPKTPEIVAIGHSARAGVNREYIDIIGKDRDEKLAEVRSHLGELDAYAKMYLDDYLEAEMPPILRSAYMAWLPDKDDIWDRASWLTQAPDDQLLNFLQWHTFRTEKINKDPETIERILVEKADYIAKVCAAVAAGKMPQVALAALDKVADTRVIVGDIFDTTMQATSGYHNVGSTSLVLEEGYSSKTFRHEMNHTVLGELPDKIQNEAITEHIALALDDGDFDNVSPKKHADRGSYLERRDMLAAMLEEGMQKIPVATALAAYCENDPAGPANRRFKEAVDDSFGVDVSLFVNWQSQQYLSEMKELHLGNSDTQDLFESSAAHAAGSLKILGQLERVNRQFPH